MGSVVSSPAWVRFKSALISSRVLGTTTSVGLVTSATLLPPLAAVVLGVPGRGEGGPGQEVGQLVQVGQERVQRLDLLALDPRALALGFSLVPLDSVQLCGQFADRPATDVLADDAAVDAAGARVVPAAL